MCGSATFVGGATFVSTLGVVKVLPNTGAALIEQIAVAVASGMIAWAIYYVRHQ